jgi:hypothetical protein
MRAWKGPISRWVRRAGVVVQKINLQTRRGPSPRLRSECPQYGLRFLKRPRISAERRGEPRLRHTGPFAGTLHGHLVRQYQALRRERLLAFHMGQDLFGALLQGEA